MVTNKEKSSTSNNQVPILTSVDMSNSQYKKTIDELSIEMFNIYTSVIAANKEIKKTVMC